MLKQNPSLCLNTQFITNEKKQIQSLKTLKLYYKNENNQDEIELDFWNDMDWSQINIIHHHNQPRKSIEDNYYEVLLQVNMVQNIMMIYTTIYTKMTTKHQIR